MLPLQFLQARWLESVASLSEALRNVVGDIVVAAGAIAYSGPFTPTFRADLLSQWTGRLAELAVPFTRNTTLIRTLEDPVQTRAWTLAGLPTDVVSIENGVLGCNVHIGNAVARARH
jgi:dynein heavy chain, axonemal